MIQRHRISTNIGEDKKITVELNNTFDLLEILSLKITQQDAYTTLCADYGVVCGRIAANNGLGIPNAKISIFIPLNDEDANDPVISALYPYKTIEDKNDDNYRYNLLPSKKQHRGHEPTGTLFDQKDILTREEILEVFEKYYKYTVKTNNSGDFMIWGVPIGTQIVHVDVDLSDINCFSLRPDDFLRKGYGVDDFKSNFEFKSSNDIDSLPQIITFNKTIEVYPFWGNGDSCEIGISRVDFDLSDKGIKIEPMAYFIGSIYTDSNNNVMSRTCVPTNHMGDKCSLTTGKATIEAIRYTNSFDENNNPILEYYEIKEEVDDDGSFVFPLPMNMDYLSTNEFGENIITNDPNKGIPTSACYRFRITMLETISSGKKTLASYLVPNIKEYINTVDEVDKSYSFSLDWGSYPTGATNNEVLFYNENGSYYPKDYFYRMNYNKVYTLSSFMGSYFKSRSYNSLSYTPLPVETFNRLSGQPFLGLKDISPKPEDDCENSIVTPPVNWGSMKFNFSILLAITVNIFERILYTSFIYAIQILITPFQALYNWKILGYNPFGNGKRSIINVDKLVIEPLQQFGTLNLGTISYPDCDICNNIDGEDVVIPNPPDIVVVDNPETVYKMILDSRVFSFVDSEEFTDPNPGVKKFYFTVPETLTPQPVHRIPADVTLTLNELWPLIYVNPNRYTFRLMGNIYQDLPFYLYRKTYKSETQFFYYMEYSPLYDESQTIINSEQIRIEIFDKEQLINEEQDGDGNGGATLNSEALPTGCSQYKTLYDDGIVRQTYCVNNINTSYENLKSTDLVNGYGCTGGKVAVGQVIGSSDSNPCVKCITKSGFSEFRNGLFRIIPAASKDNWDENRKALDEYCRRKLVSKLFCEGIVNYSFIDNWLSGSLYFFPFKSRIRWDNEENLDLNVKRSSYCTDLVYYKTGTINEPVKRFYYKSSRYNPFLNKFSLENTLAHPTTMVDLGPRDEFIKEICVDESLDPNCSVVRKIGSTTHQNFKEMLGLYINYTMDINGTTSNPNIFSFFKNLGFDTKIPFEMKGRILNGDLMQLLSINNEAGIDGFDLQNKKYSFYNPAILDAEQNIEFFKDDNGLVNGPLPIKFELDEDEGYNLRACLNEPGRLTESSQPIPFYLWNKNGSGFGTGLNHSWDYFNINIESLQGMTYGYRYSGNETHPYVLFPMTKLFSGETILTNTTFISREEMDFDVEYLNKDSSGELRENIDENNFPHRKYNSQEEGFTFLYITYGVNDNELEATEGLLYIRTGNAKPNGENHDIVCWKVLPWSKQVDFVIKPTTTNYTGNKQILSTPFLFYFGIKPGKTAIDKFIDRFGNKNSF